MKRPCVGDVVRLNDFGIKQQGGLTTWAMVAEAKRMTITRVEDFGLREEDGTTVYGVDVDSFLINRHCHTSRDFDLLTLGVKRMKAA